MKNIKEIGDFFINLNEYVYATDIETNEIVYMNHKALKAYGLESIEDIKGKKCYEVLQKASPHFPHLRPLHRGHPAVSGAMAGRGADHPQRREESAELPAVFVVHEYVLRAAASDAVSQRPVAESRHPRRPAGPAGGAVGTDRAARYGQYLPSA